MEKRIKIGKIIVILKKKLKLEPEELKVVPVSVGLHVFFADSFGFTRMREILIKFGQIESLQIGIGYLKTVHSKENIHRKENGEFQSIEMVDVIKVNPYKKINEADQKYLKSINSKFLNYLEIGYQKELNQREKEEKEKSEKIGKKIGEKIGEQIGEKK